MAGPTVQGRPLPQNDWEGDDHTPGAGGRYVTCVDTSVGRMVAWATAGRINKDGATYRSALNPPDSGGISMRQAVIEASRVAGLKLLIPKWGVREVTAQLTQQKGLIVIGKYASLPREDRFQDNADFLHCLFLSHLDTAGNAVRGWDPLNRKPGYGMWYPMSVMMPFIVSGGYDLGYINLEPVSV